MKRNCNSLLPRNLWLFARKRKLKRSLAFCVNCGQLLFEPSRYQLHSLYCNNIMEIKLSKNHIDSHCGQTFTLQNLKSFDGNQKSLRQTFNILIKSWQIYCKDNKKVFGLSCFEWCNSKFSTRNSKNVEPIKFRVVWSSFWVMIS